MKILLTGAHGQLGQAILEAPRSHEIHPAGHKRLLRDDLVIDLGEPSTLRRAVLETNPDWIIHGAAMTNVDACERDALLAHRLNAEATGTLAEAAREAGSRMTYVSTDYVYDGEKGNYVESDATNPISHYGRSKLIGEVLAAAALPNVLIARTSVVYGPHKKNFVTWAIDELRARRPIRVVTDQVVTPTSTRDLAAQLLSLMERNAHGIFHTAGSTRLTRFDMAVRIAEAFDLDAELIQPILSTDLTWVARRPLDSSLDTSKVFKYQVPLGFEEALGFLRADLGKPST